MDEMQLPRQAAKYISLQRLETQSIGRNLHYTGFGKVLYVAYEKVPVLRLFLYYAANIEPMLRSGKINSPYDSTLKGEFGTLKSSLPSSAEIVVGIGPGIGGLEILISRLFRKLSHKPPQIVLLDKTGIDPIYYGFRDVAAAYNSLEFPGESLALSGQPREKIEPVAAEVASTLLDRHRGKVDLVTSLIAWGFPFPLESYLDLFLDLLKKDGRVIVDVRRGTNGREVLSGRFSDAQVIHNDEKFDRFLAIR